jgi:hypothetical protein
MTRMRTAACWVAAAIAAAGIGVAVRELTAPGPAPAMNANQVAAIVQATQFTDCGSSALGGVTDAGTAYLGGEKIGINVFPSTAVRDQWEQLAEPLGVVPLEQGSTWVIYHALRQSGTACS